jgi:hypothetical protein
MAKSKTAIALTAGAIANLALAGFVAAPASATTHDTAAGPAAVGAKTGGVLRSGTFTEKVSPQIRREMEKWLAGENAGAAGSSRLGFVPGAGAASGRQAGVKPDTRTYCSANTCFGVHGAGLFVSYVDEHFFNYNTCHYGQLWIYGAHFSTFPTLLCSKADFRVDVSGSFSRSGQASGYFNHVPPYPTKLHAGIVR